MQRTYLTEFPTFAAETLPDIPADWIDVSWHHDTAPSWKAGELYVYIDYAERELREFPDGPRFTVQTGGADVEILYHGDDWAEVLKTVSEFPAKALAHLFSAVSPELVDEARRACIGEGEDDEKLEIVEAVYMHSESYGRFYAVKDKDGFYHSVCERESIYTQDRAALAAWLYVRR